MGMLKPVLRYKENSWSGFTALMDSMLGNSPYTMHVYKILEQKYHFKLVTYRESYFISLISKHSLNPNECRENPPLQIFINYVNSITPFFCIPPNNINQFIVCTGP